MSANIVKLDIHMWKLGRWTFSVHSRWHWGRPFHVASVWVFAYCFGPLLVTLDRKRPVFGTVPSADALAEADALYRQLDVYGSEHRCVAAALERHMERQRYTEKDLAGETKRADAAEDECARLRTVVAQVEDMHRGDHTDGCDNDECSVCAVLDRPHADPLHYHHDGCPACVQAEAQEGG